MASSGSGGSAGGAFDWGFQQLRGGFFDTEVVMKALNTFERKVLSKFGAYARTRIKSSIRKAPLADAKTGEVKRGRKKRGVEYVSAISQPGKPPYSREGSYKRLIYFAYDAARHSVVVGPAKFKKGDVPRLLEFGGPSTDKYGRPVFYRPRPHVFPACHEEVRRFPLTLRSNA